MDRLWRHYKSSIVYDVLSMQARIERDGLEGAVHVVYRSTAEDGRVWVRPLSEWEQVVGVADDGHPLTRFTQLVPPMCGKCGAQRSRHAGLCIACLPPILEPEPEPQPAPAAPQPAGRAVAICSDCMGLSADPADIGEACNLGIVTSDGLCLGQFEPFGTEVFG